MDQFRNAAAAARPNFNGTADGTAWHNVTTRMPVGESVGGEKNISKQI